MMTTTVSVHLLFINKTWHTDKQSFGHCPRARDGRRHPVVILVLLLDFAAFGPRYLSKCSWMSSVSVGDAGSDSYELAPSPLSLFSRSPVAGADDTDVAVGRAGVVGALAGASTDDAVVAKDDSDDATVPAAGSTIVDAGTTLSDTPVIAGTAAPVVAVEAPAATSSTVCAAATSTAPTSSPVSDVSAVADNDACAVDVAADAGDGEGTVVAAEVEAGPGAAMPPLLDRWPLALV